MFFVISCAIGYVKQAALRFDYTVLYGENL